MTRNQPSEIDKAAARLAFETQCRINARKAEAAAKAAAEAKAD